MITTALDQSRAAINALQVNHRGKRGYVRKVGTVVRDVTKPIAKAATYALAAEFLVVVYYNHQINKGYEELKQAFTGTTTHEYDQIEEREETRTVTISWEVRPFKLRDIEIE